MEKISIVLYKFDGQYDVEVYNWIEELNEQGEQNEKLTNYGFEEKTVAKTYIEELKEQYDIVKLSQKSDEDNEEYEEVNEVSEDYFWELIDKSLKQKDLENQRNWLMHILAKMPNEKIEAFEETFTKIERDMKNCKYFQHAYRLADVNGGDDSIDYFGGWLISRGKQAFEAILANPLVIEEYMSEEWLEENGKATNESFLYVASYAQREKWK